jgi:hypothetical protein
MVGKMAGRKAGRYGSRQARRKRRDITCRKAGGRFVFAAERRASLFFRTKKPWK